MNKKLVTRILAFFLVMVLVLGLFAGLTVSAAEDGVVIKLHYNRPDGEYADWSVWFWNLGMEGVDTPFVKEGGEMVATWNVAPGVTSVGFIVRTPDWGKDVDKDQFIDVAAYTSGTVHVYVESGVEGYTVVNGDDLVSGVKARAVVYKEG